MSLSDIVLCLLSAKENAPLAAICVVLMCVNIPHFMLCLLTAASVTGRAAEPDEGNASSSEDILLL